MVVAGREFEVLTNRPVRFRLYSSVDRADRVGDLVSVSPGELHALPPIVTVLRFSRSSQDIPLKCFASGAQVHPYTFFSLKKNPVHEPKDFIGKRVGIQATGVILLRALLAANKIPEDKVKIVTIGAEMTPLLTGQVDVVTGWLTNIPQPGRVGFRALAA